MAPGSKRKAKKKAGNGSNTAVQQVETTQATVQIAATPHTSMTLSETVTDTTFKTSTTGTEVTKDNPATTSGNNNPLNHRGKWWPISWSFFGWAGIVTLFFIFIVSLHTCSFKQGQDRIVNVHTRLLNTSDSLCYASCQSLVQQLAATDSTIDVTQLTNNLQSDWLEAADVQTRESIKSLLELEFEKIQHEYDVLALWGGMLTIVFLIFTFYSLSKIDEINKESQNTYDKIQQSYSQAEALKRKVEQIKDNVENSEKKIDNRIQSVVDKTETLYDEKLKGISSNCDRLLSKLDSNAEVLKTYDNYIEDLNKQFEEIQANAQQLVEQTRKDTEHSFKMLVEQKVAGINKEKENFENQLQEFQKIVNKLVERLGENETPSQPNDTDENTNVTGDNTDVKYDNNQRPD